MTYQLRQQLVAIAKREIGVHEVGSSNSGKRVKEYQAATNLGGTGWPWCAAFVCWCVKEWLKMKDVQSALGLKNAAAVERWRPKTAAAFGFEYWAEMRGLTIFNDAPGHVLHTGDLMVFDMSHIGIVEDDDNGNRIITVEGNTTAAGSRDGGGVYGKVRQRSEARSFIRMMP